MYLNFTYTKNNVAFAGLFSAVDFVDISYIIKNPSAGFPVKGDVSSSLQRQ